MPFAPSVTVPSAVLPSLNVTDPPVGAAYGDVTVAVNVTALPNGSVAEDAARAVAVSAIPTVRVVWAELLAR